MTQTRSDPTRVTDACLIIIIIIIVIVLVLGTSGHSTLLLASLLFPLGFLLEWLTHLPIQA